MGGAILDYSDPGFGIYVHWPFCAAKCPYCDFNSHVRHKPVDQPRFVAAFQREILQMRAITGARTVTSIFFGGGTPSLMAPQTVDEILSAIGRAWDVAIDAEITLEANPSSVEAERFRGYRAAGVNRVSLGVQALNDSDLKTLGRLHSVSEALTAIELARETFPRLSFDLIYARPGQSVQDWERELDAAIGHAADHLSLYQLTIEQGTPFYGLYKSGRLKIPDGDLSADLYEATQALTSARGLPAYEVSNHAVPGAESRHNLTYWRYGDYVGLGAGAHGRLSHAYGRIGTVNRRLPEQWLEQVETLGHGMESEERLDTEAQADELMLMGLRLREGFDVTRWRDLSGRSVDPDKESFLISHGLLERLGNSRLRCTPAGMMVLDAVVADLAA
ncbi:radical SAM family heme chaperone HemW [Hoeflea poritis]|uniref:Heme chaperone HemW n=1 Tax=Hoeflea poritis TaxID=2993659 RepID=A0ABT4VKF7_9HYPH|nr:radical SAM family heme chaperone HemW [Hoeflea poritis]MDA4845196.1 radical SAM family heme chaperone HemW [Hoeflea poritis]